MRRIAEKIFKFSDADETEVEIGVVSDALTRFANNTIHQNVAEQVLNVSVRTVLDGRTARATTNKTDDDSLRRVVDTSKSLARSQPRNPDLLPMPGPQKYGKVSRYFESTAYATPADRARAVARVAELAEKNKQTAAGIFTTGVTQSAIANTRGLFASHRQTRAEFSITILESNSSGWAKANSPDLGRYRSHRSRPQRQRKIRRFAQTNRGPARSLDCDSRTRRRARSGRVSLLRFRGNVGRGPALVLQQAHGQKNPRRQHHAPRRRVSPAAVRRALRWRGHSAPENPAGR